MSENPLQAIFQTFERVSHAVQTQLSQFVGLSHNSLSTNERPPPSPLFSVSNIDLPIKKQSSQPVSKEELGRATWTFLHTLGAQFPDKPTRQQKKDVKELMAILSRMYPLQGMCRSL